MEREGEGRWVERLGELPNQREGGKSMVKGLAFLGAFFFTIFFFAI